MEPPQLEWSEDEEQLEAVEVKTENIFTEAEIEIKSQMAIGSLEIDF